MRYQAIGAKSPALTKRTAFAVGIVAAGLSATPALAGGTPAGTNITNVATATYELANGNEASVDSNKVTLVVDELLDVTVASAEPADVIGSPALTGAVLRFTVTNAGNGSEAFELVAAANGGGDDFDPVVTGVILDSNGNGAYDAGVDLPYVGGANDPELAPDEAKSVFVLSTLPAGVTDAQRGKVQLQARAKTGSGTPGTAFAGAGQGGGNAVVGATGGAADDEAWYKIAAAAIAFAKSAIVADPFGGTTQGPGAIVTYTLTATVTGSGSLANVRVTDPVPEGTTYQAGSIVLDAGALTDAQDADRGRFTGSAIEVGLGTLAAGSTRTIRFQVKID